MTSPIRVWLESDQEPPNLYVLVNRPLFDPDRQRLEESVREAYGELLKYQNHQDPKVVKRALNLQWQLGRFAAMLADGTQLRAHHLAILTSLRNELASEVGREASLTDLQVWLEERRRVHPDSVARASYLLRIRERETARSPFLDTLGVGPAPAGSATSPSETGASEPEQELASEPAEPAAVEEEDASLRELLALLRAPRRAVPESVSSKRRLATLRQSLARGRGALKSLVARVAARMGVPARQIVEVGVAGAVLCSVLAVYGITRIGGKDAEEDPAPASVDQMEKGRESNENESLPADADSSSTALDDRLTGEKEIAIDVGNGVKLEMVLIPAGGFRMGSAGNNSFERQRNVRITKPFYLGKYEVTQAQWQAVMGNNPSAFKETKNPVERVSWNDCQEFVRRLDERVGSGKFSLPTEAQWEYACRAGSTTHYCFGDDAGQLIDHGWGLSSHEGTHPVGEKKANHWGLYDMHGNVSEWCLDGFGNYQGTDVEDPVWMEAQPIRVHRGGAWLSPPGECRSAARNAQGPERRDRRVGFRVARTVSPVSAIDSLALNRRPVIKPISAQLVEAGKELSLDVSVADAADWPGKLEYSLGPEVVPGARIDAATGVFRWTPTSEQAGLHDLTVYVVASNSRRDQREFRVTVTRPTPRPEVSTLPRETTVALGNNVVLTMVLIPAGKFDMGSPTEDDKASADEKPPRRIPISEPFWLGKFEVTQEQWQEVMGNNPSHCKGSRNPVEGVTWEDCQKFLGRLNEIRGGPKFVLPTEAQWEYACRAGSTARYCYGDDASRLSEYAWDGSNSDQRLHPVGEKLPNAWGLHDVHGNVREWCEDRYDRSEVTTQKLPAGHSMGSLRVIRGGGWADEPSYCRSANRAGLMPESRSDVVGFRIARLTTEASEASRGMDPQPNADAGRQAPEPSVPTSPPKLTDGADAKQYERWLAIKADPRSHIGEELEMTGDIQQEFPEHVNVSRLYGQSDSVEVRYLGRGRLLFDYARFANGETIRFGVRVTGGSPAAPRLLLLWITTVGTSGQKIPLPSPPGGQKGGGSQQEDRPQRESRPENPFEPEGQTPTRKASGTSGPKANAPGRSDADQAEERARQKLRLARNFLNSNSQRAVELLLEVIKDYPNTKAAGEAKAELKKRE